MLPLQDPVIDSIKAAIDRLTNSTNFLSFLAQHAFIMQEDLLPRSIEEEQVDDQRYHFCVAPSELPQLLGTTCIHHARRLTSLFQLRMTTLLALEPLPRLVLLLEQWLLPRSSLLYTSVRGQIVLISSPLYLAALSFSWEISCMLWLMIATPFGFSSILIGRIFCGYASLVVTDCSYICGKSHECYVMPYVMLEKNVMEMDEDD